MSPCPNLFDLIYQHAAFPFTGELAALTAAVLLFSAYTLLLMQMLPEGLTRRPYLLHLGADHRVNHYIVRQLQKRQV